jgi:hypothetical protein
MSQQLSAVRSSVFDVWHQLLNGRANHLTRAFLDRARRIPRFALSWRRWYLVLLLFTWISVLLHGCHRDDDTELFVGLKRAIEPLLK